VIGGIGAAKKKTQPNKAKLKRQTNLIRAVSAAQDKADRTAILAVTEEKDAEGRSALLKAIPWVLGATALAAVAIVVSKKRGGR